MKQKIKRILSGVLAAAMLSTSFPAALAAGKEIVAGGYEIDMSDLPQVHFEQHPEWEELYNAAWEFHKGNIQAISEGLNPELTNDEQTSYYVDEAFDNRIFQWDTLFMMMFDKYGLHQFPTLNSMDNFYYHQWDTNDWKDGYISRMIYESDGSDYYKDCTSVDAINPPLFGWAEWEQYQIHGDVERFTKVIRGKPIIDRLDAYFQFIKRNRTLQDGSMAGLYVSNGQGNGLDNTPNQGGWRQAANDMSLQQVQAADYIVKICREILEKDQNLTDEECTKYTAMAEEYEKERDDLKALIQNKLWSDSGSFFFNAYADSGELTNIATPTGLWALAAGVATEEQAEAMIDGYARNSEKLYRPNGLSTVTYDYGTFKPTGGYWNGAMWSPTSYQWIKGLQQYGYDDLAFQEAVRHIEALSDVYQDGADDRYGSFLHTLWENYSSEYDIPGSTEYNDTEPSRTDFVGWTGALAIGSMIEDVVGVTINGPENEIDWNIHLTEGHGISNLYYHNADTGENRVSLSMERRASATSPAVITVTAQKALTLRVTNGETVQTLAVEPGTHTYTVGEGSGQAASLGVVVKTWEEADLTAADFTGAADYVWFNQNEDTTIDDGLQNQVRKSGSLITNVNTVGYRADSSQNPVTLRENDELSTLGFTGAQDLVKESHVHGEEGFMFTTTADNDLRTAYVVVGVQNATAELEAAISDASSPRVTRTVTGGEEEAVYVLEVPYRAGTAGSQVLFQYRIMEDAEGKTGNISLKAILLENGGTEIPPQLSGVTVESGNGCLTVDASSPALLGYEGYLVRLGTDPEQMTEYQTASLPYTITGLQNDTRYYLTVSGVRNDVEGAASPVMTAVPEKTPRSDTQRAYFDYAQALEEILNENASFDAVSQNLSFDVTGSVYGSTFSFYSASDLNDWGVRNDGTVTRPVGEDKTTTLTVVIRCGSATVTLEQPVTLVGRTGEELSKVVGAMPEVPGSVNLTDEGTLDWVQFDQDSVTSFAAKENVERKIQVSAVGSLKGTANDAPFTFTAADGSPKNNYGVITKGEGNGYTITLPYGEKTQVARIYAAVWAGTVTVTAEAGGAVYEIGSVSKDTGSGLKGQCFEIKYQLPSQTDTLTVHVLCTENLDHQWGGCSNVLQAITLGETEDELPDPVLPEEPEDLSVSVSRQPDTANLTSQGNLDWVLFDDESVTNAEQKQGGEAIQNLRVLGGVERVDSGNGATDFTFTDGTKQRTGSKNCNMVLNGQGNGISFTVPYSEGQQRLKLYFGAWSARATLTATVISNGEPTGRTASRSFDTGSMASGTPAVYQAFTVDFQLNEGETLAVTLETTQVHDTNWGNINVSAVALGRIYTVTTKPTVNGTLSAGVAAAYPGETVSLRITPAEGYQRGDLTVMSGDKTVEVKNDQFVMPAGDVTISCEFEEIPETHEHTYDQQVATEQYLKDPATCTSPAVYYYSCKCGQRGTETFTSGEALGHNFDTAWSSDGTGHWHVCTRCGAKGEVTEHTPGPAATETAPQTCTVCGYELSPKLPAEDSTREEISLNGAWKFLWNGTEKSNAPGTADYDDSTWEQVTVPHCWNADDGADGGNDYRRGEGWYRKTVTLDLEELAGKQVYFECEALSQEADVYVNGTHVGNHKGGYTAFRYDITEYLKDGENVIAVRGDNSNGGMDNTTIAPIVGDFTVYGGMYRDVSLIVTDEIHVDTVGEPCHEKDGGFETAPGSGLYLTTTEVSDTSATLTVEAKIVNDGSEEREVTVTAVLREPDGFEEVEGITPRFDVSNMGDGSTVDTVTQTFTIPAGGSVDFAKTINVENPRLWNGVTDPFRYQVDLTVEAAGAVTDSVSDYVGFRYFSVDEGKGFFLNGQPYNLRGVSRHQDRPGQGYALTMANHEEDFAMIYEMGANSIRLAHYPQDDYMYELCDRYGLAVWAEIPYIGGNNNNTTANQEANELLRKTTKQQLRELILQNYNHPSILIWGLENEVGHQANADLAKDWIKDMNALAKALDPSRLTAMATNTSAAEGWDSDLIAWNKYPGWYESNLNNLGSTLDSIRWHGDWRPVGISEYGAGANIYQHEYNTSTRIPSAGGSWHPEEFQSDLHEAAIRAIKERDYLWCTFVWNMFDFGSDGRNEGEQPGINDKGLVTFDRQVKKDSFYLYKANWNTWEPFVHITSSRDNPRYQEVIEEVKVYSNCDSVSITVNGSDPIQLTSEGYGVFSTKNVTLLNGGEENPNVVVATGTKGGKTYTDTCEWIRQASNDNTLSSDVLQVNNDRKTIGLTQEVTVENLDNVIQVNDSRATWAFEEAGLTGVIEPGTRLIVTAEDGSKATYTFVTLYLNYKKPVTASSVQSGNDAANAVDFNSSTRWAAEQSFQEGGAQWLTIDLEAVYRLTNIRIDWFNSNYQRAYQYTVEVSTDGITYTQVIDRSENTKQDSVSDVLYECEARYVRINVSGCTAATLSASLYEVVINGWSLSSQSLEIDHENRVITVGAEDVPGGLLLPTDFASLLEIQGDCSYEIRTNGGNYYLVDGDELVIIGGDGKQVAYAIDMPSGTELVYGNIATGKPVTVSSYNEKKDYPYYINDGNLATRWAALGRGSAENEPRFPEWAVVDLGQVYDLSSLNLKFYKYNDGGRQYQYEILVSEDGKDFARVVDATQNTDPSGDFTHDLTGQKARYVKVNVTAADGGEWSLASIYELSVYGRIPGTQQPQTPPAPGEGYTIDYASETISVESGYELYTAQEGGTRVSGSISAYIGQTLYIRKAATETHLASDWTAVSIPARPAAPANLSSVNETIAGQKDGKITGVDGSMEYRLKENGAWTDCTGTEITNLAPGTYEVRVKATATAFAGSAGEVTITTGMEATCNLTITAPAFGTITQGSQVAAQPITITNSGNSAATIAGVTVSGESFTLTGSETSVPAGDSIQSYTIQPKEDLPVGTHTATITVTYNGGKTATAEVTVTVQAATVSVTGVTLDKNTLTLTEGGSEQLTATVLPENATNRNVTWSSSDSAVATVKDGLVQAIQAGSATITVTTVDGEKTATCEVTVTASACNHKLTEVAAKKPTCPETGNIQYWYCEDCKGYFLDKQATQPISQAETVLAPLGHKGGEATCVSKAVCKVCGAEYGEKDLNNHKNVQLVGYRPATVAQAGYTGDRVCQDCETVLTKGKEIPKLSGGNTHPIKPVDPVEPTEPDTTFVDVNVGDWYEEAVSYVAEKGLMTGVGNGKFNPDGAVTRAMVWTVLARMAGENTEGGSTWYSKARAWAMETGVSDGTNPMGSITREQLAAMLYRYEGSPAVSGNLNAYPDGNAVSSWAVDAMVWATEEGIINGINGYLKPQSGATRAQLATMLMRFTEEK